MADPLTPGDLALLQAAAARLGANDGAGAAAVLARLSPAARDHPDALHFGAIALMGQGRTADALAAFAQAVDRAPDHQATLDSYARLLRHVLGGNPADAVHWASLGAVEQARGDSDAAAAAFGEALAIRPHDQVSRHNLGVALRSGDRLEAALGEIDGALAGGLAAPETATIRAHLLAELGRFDEAVAQYGTVLRAHPAHLDAHETLARLLPQIGRAPEALESYRTILGKTAGAALWLSALGSAKAVGDPAQVLAWARDAATALGADPILSVIEAKALSDLDEDVAARDLLVELVARAPEDHAARVNLAHVLIRSGDVAGAEIHAAMAAQLQPLDQTGWALLSVIWRVLGDPREHWLADYDRLVMPIEIPEPPARDELRHVLEALHTTQMHPAEQSLRGGTQTRGILFDKREPAIRALAEAIRTGVERRLAELPADDTHPFLVRNTGGIAFQGSWSVRLASAGFHISHIHPAGWLSSAFYVALPPEVAGSGKDGALGFGVPDAALKLDLPARRIVSAREGRLVVFPSYLWHGTLPFESASPRLTVAFDALPVDTRARAG